MFPKPGGLSGKTPGGVWSWGVRSLIGCSCLRLSLFGWGFRWAYRLTLPPPLPGEPPQVHTRGPLWVGWGGLIARAAPLGLQRTSWCLPQEDRGAIVLCPTNTQRRNLSCGCGPAEPLSSILCRLLWAETPLSPGRAPPFALRGAPLQDTQEGQSQVTGRVGLHSPSPVKKEQRKQVV